MFQQQKAKRRRKVMDESDIDPPEAYGGESDDDNDADADDENDETEQATPLDDHPVDNEPAATDSTTLGPGKEWKKHVEHHLRRWIQTKECRRNLLDKYFDNPRWTRKGVYG